MRNIPVIFCKIAKMTLFYKIPKIKITNQKLQILIYIFRALQRIAVLAKTIVTKLNQNSLFAPCLYRCVFCQFCYS